MSERTSVAAEYASLAAAAAQAATAEAMNSLPVVAEVNDQPSWWYLVICDDGCDARAMRWLTRRGFGMFQPMMRGKDGRLVPAYPGYLFARVWNMEKLYERLVNTPGVASVLMQFGAPARVPDSFVTRLMQLHWLEEGSSAGKHVAVKSKRNRPGQRERRASRGAARQAMRAKALRKEQRRLMMRLAEAGQLAAADRIGAMLAALKEALPSGSKSCYPRESFPRVRERGIDEDSEPIHQPPRDNAS
jgi:hypothetical protein